MNPICLNPSNPSIENTPACISRKMEFVLLTITTIGALVAGAGLSSFGAQQEWWSTGTLSHLSQTNSIILMGSGGIASIALISFIIALVKRPKQPEYEPTVSSTLGPPVDPSQIKSEQMRQGLQTWIEERALSQERRGSQETAAVLILDCFINNVPSLSLRSYDLTSLPPQIGQLTQITGLNLSHNQLTTLPPQMGRLTQIRVLDLSDNHLTSLSPPIGLFTQITVLDLGINHLTFLPSEVGQLYQLIDLNLCINHLTSFPPEIEQLTQLRVLGLGLNQLISLPESILSLPARLTIDLSGNRLSLRVLNNLREIINTSGYHGPRIHFSIPEERSTDDRSLEELLQELSTAAGKEPITLTQLVKHAEDVHLWLSRLSAIGDYRNKRQELALLIYYAIAKADTEDGFRDIFLSCIQDAATTCGDRMALSVLYLGIQYKIAQALAVRDLGQLAYLLGHGSWALDQLGEIAKAKARSLRFVDEVEVYLAYPVMLKNRLQLPIVIDTMLYFGCSSVAEENLNTAKEVVQDFLSNLDSYCEYLAKDTTWQKALASDSKYISLLNTRNGAADYEAAARQFQDELKALTQNVLQEVGYPPFLGPTEG